jgi:hypothetical protein
VASQISPQSCTKKKELITPVILQLVIDVKVWS